MGGSGDGTAQFLFVSEGCDLGHSIAIENYRVDQRAIDYWTDYTDYIRNITSDGEIDPGLALWICRAAISIELQPGAEPFQFLGAGRGEALSGAYLYRI